MGNERKIYTKTGDKGETSLLGGTRVLKCDRQVEAYGTIDELNSFIGMIRDHAIDPHYQQVLQQVQENLFTAEALVAVDPGKAPQGLPELSATAAPQLEKEIDEMNTFLPELTHFILPGGHPAVSACHVARTVCRRAERRVIEIRKSPGDLQSVILYLNRLSDYLFVLARKVGLDFGANETGWTPGKEKNV